jgi:hypothetical protein
MLILSLSAIRWGLRPQGQYADRAGCGGAKGNDRTTVISIATHPVAGHQGCLVGCQGAGSQRP